MEWLCRECEFSTQTIRNQMSAIKWPSVDKILKIAQVLDMTVDSLLTGTEKTAGTVLVPVQEQTLSAGHGQTVPGIDTIIDYIAVPNTLRQYGQGIAAFRVHGDSMEHTLFDGDYIICDNRGYDGEGVYNIRLRGNGFVKRIQTDGKNYIVVSDNKKYSNLIEPLESDDIDIIGKVRYIMHRCG